MIITRVGSGSAEATTVTIPAGHQAGDIIIIFAFNGTDTTVPTVPGGWTSLGGGGGSVCAHITAWKIAVASDVSGTWTGATGLMCHVYRGVDSIKPFSSPTSTNNTTSPSFYQTTAGARMDNQWALAFQGNKSTDTTTMTTPPTGHTLVISGLGAVQDMVSFDTNGPVQEGFATNSVAPGGTAAGWRTTTMLVHPAMARLNNYQAPRSISAGVISVSEKIR